MKNGMNLSGRWDEEDKRILTGTVLPFGPPASWYVSYWYDEPPSRSPENRCARLARELVRLVMTSTHKVRMPRLSRTTLKSLTRPSS